MTIASLAMVITFIVYIEHHHCQEQLLALSGTISSIMSNVTHSNNLNLLLIVSIIVVRHHHLCLSNEPEEKFNDKKNER